jgi:hypothetical protein
MLLGWRGAQILLNFAANQARDDQADGIGRDEELAGPLAKMASSSPRVAIRAR